MANKRCFLFGAGAEISFGLPSGAQFIEDTILTKNGQLYKALSMFYSGNYNGLKYSERFLFPKSSNVFKKIIQRSAVNYLKIETENEDLLKEIENVEENNKQEITEIEKVLEQTQIEEPSRLDIIKFLSIPYEFLQAQKTNYRKTDKEKEQKYEYLCEKYNGLMSLLYSYIVDDQGDAVEKHTDCKMAKIIESDYCTTTNGHNIKAEIDNIIKNIKSNLQYYGIIEQYFNTIINPKKYGEINFWKLVNYFWSAYFSILIPTLKFYFEYEENFLEANLGDDAKIIKDNISKSTNNLGADTYTKILNNLGKINKELWKKREEFSQNKSYYEILATNIGNKSIPIITTNYTPFLTQYFEEKNIAFLAGKLCQMEDYEKLRIIDMTEEEIENSACFPFLMTQAPIKPIVVKEQIIEYKKAIKFLDNASELFLLGYGLNNNDNHINSIIGDWYSGKDKKIIYFYYSQYSKENTDKENTDKEKERLKKEYPWLDINEEDDINKEKDKLKIIAITSEDDFEEKLKALIPK